MLIQSQTLSDSNDKYSVLFDPFDPKDQSNIERVNAEHHVLTSALGRAIAKVHAKGEDDSREWSLDIAVGRTVSLKSDRRSKYCYVITIDFGSNWALDTRDRSGQMGLRKQHECFLDVTAQCMRFGL